MYASNEARERRVLWEDLVSTSRSMISKKWLAIGDYNEIMFSHERSGQGAYDERGPTEFKVVIGNSELQELEYTPFLSP